MELEPSPGEEQIGKGPKSGGSGRWSKTTSFFGLPHFAPHTPSFQLLAYMITCRGINPALNLSLAGIRPDFLLRAEIRQRAGEVMQTIPDEYVFKEEDANKWVSILRPSLHHGLAWLTSR